MVSTTLSQHPSLVQSHVIKETVPLLMWYEYPSMKKAAISKPVPKLIHTKNVLEEDTHTMLRAANRYLPDGQLDKLIQMENRYAWERKTNRFPRKLTPEMERYLANTSIPFTKGFSTSAKVIDLWNLSPFIDERTERLGKVCMPTGNLAAKYMILGDVPISVASPAGVKWGKYFDRAWTRGVYSSIIRRAMEELQIASDCWYTNLLKQYTPVRYPSLLGEVLTHKPYLLNEIQTVRPDYIICLGKHAYDMYQQSIGYREHVDARIVQVRHPSYYAKNNLDRDSKKLAQELFPLLFS